MNDEVVRAFASALYAHNVGKTLEALKAAESYRKIRGPLVEKAQHSIRLAWQALESIIDLSCVTVHLSHDAFLVAYGIDAHEQVLKEAGEVGAAVAAATDGLLLAVRAHGLAWANTPGLEGDSADAETEVKRAARERREQILSLYARLGEETIKCR